MDNCPARLSSIGQLFPGCVSDEKSRSCQNGSPSFAGAEVICPEPRRATRVPCIVDSLSRLNSMSRSIFPVHKGNNGLEILNAILGKDDLEGDADPGNRVGFFWGSPPVRTNNPMVHDAQFTKQTLPTASPMGCSYGVTPSRLERGSPSCGSPLGTKPKVRVEGFSCGSPKSRIVPALA